jgi:hypothetical protein
VLTAPVALVLALLFVLEDWLWQPLLGAMVALGRLPPVRWLETRIQALPSWPALAVFVVPALVLLPFKFVGLMLIGQGKRALGLAVFLLAKVVGTALFARLYQLTAPALRRLAWFARWQDRFLAYKAAIYQRVFGNRFAQAVLRAARRLKLRLRAVLGA